MPMICGYWQCLLHFYRDCKKSLKKPLWSWWKNYQSGQWQGFVLPFFPPYRWEALFLLLELDSKNRQGIKAAHRVALGLHGGNQDQNMTSGFISSKGFFRSSWLAGRLQLSHFNSSYLHLLSSSKQGKGQHLLSRACYGSWKKFV